MGQQEIIGDLYTGRIIDVTTGELVAESPTPLGGDAARAWSSKTLDENVGRLDLAVEYIPSSQMPLF